MAPAAAELGVLFADVCDSPRLYAGLGNVDARRDIVRGLDAAQRAVEAVGGSVVDRIGDDIMCTGPTAEASVRAAVGIQTALRDARVEGQLPHGIRMRVGFHFGPVMRDGGRVFGDTVHVARRVATQAHADRILTTRDTLRQLPAAMRVPQRAFDVLRLKGKPEAFGLVEILWDSHTATLELGTENSTAAGIVRQALHLRHGQELWIANEARPTITIGREECDVVVRHERVSRLHARIEFKRRGFYLVDLSTNGTMVRGTSGVPIRVHRAELRLEDRGRLALGMAEGPDAPTLDFSIEHEGQQPN